jgi:hypothetical protein
MPTLFTRLADGFPDCVHIPPNAVRNFFGNSAVRELRIFGPMLVCLGLPNLCLLVCALLTFSGYCTDSVRMFRVNLDSSAMSPLDGHLAYD